jgi:FkbM family methyltransferase
MGATSENRLSAETRDRDDLSAAMRLAVFLNRALPRGKGAVPRWIGSMLHGGPTRHIFTSHGANIVVEPSSLDVYASIVNSGRTWNWHVLAACAALLRPGDTFFDIGANIGFMSLELSMIFRSCPGKPGIRVVAFEPLPPLVNAIRASVQLNAGATIEVRDEIVSDFAGTTDLFLGSHSIHASTRAREQDSQMLKLPRSTSRAMSFRPSAERDRRYDGTSHRSSSNPTRTPGVLATRNATCAVSSPDSRPSASCDSSRTAVVLRPSLPTPLQRQNQADIPATTLLEPAISAASDSIRSWMGSGSIVPTR